MINPGHFCHHLRRRLTKILTRRSSLAQWKGQNGHALIPRMSNLGNGCMGRCLVKYGVGRGSGESTRTRLRILIASRQATEKTRPFLLVGVLTTWIDAYNFGADKLRLGGGMAVTIGSRSRFRAQYMFERSFFRSPMINTNIFWLRYEANFGIP